MKHILYAGIGAALLAAPLVASADVISDLEAQIQALLSRVTTLQTQLKTTQSQPTQPPTPIAPVTPHPQSTSNAGGFCPQLARTLSLGVSGADVNDLQRFLGITLTGYFDTATENAVRAWQSSHGIASSGTAATTGYGLVGPRTRNLIALNCNIQPSCPVAPKQPITDLCKSGTWSKTYDAGCHVGWQCSGTTVALPQCPVIVQKPAATCSGYWKELRNTAGCTTGWECSAIPNCPIVQTPSCGTGQHAEASAVDTNNCVTAYKCVNNTSSCTNAVAVCGVGYHAGGSCNEQCIPDTVIGNALTATPTAGNPPLTVVFKTQYGDSSAIRPSAYDGSDTLLDFGDGSTPQWLQCLVTSGSASARTCGSFISVSHTYTTAGTYTVTLKREGGYCAGPCTPTILSTLTIQVGGGNTDVPSVVSQKYAQVAATYRLSLGASIKACTGALGTVYVVQGSGGFTAENHYYNSSGSLLGSVYFNDTPPFQTGTPPITISAYSCRTLQSTSYVN